VVWAWLVFGIVLLLVELHHLAFYALFVAVGAFAAAAVAVVAPGAPLAQGAVAVGVSVFGVVAIRPYAERAYQSHRRTGHVALGVHGGLIGAEAVTLDEVGEAEDVGHVRLAGERWLAVSGAGADRIPSGTRVVVTAVHGTTLTVWPPETSTVPPYGLGRDGSTT
jgi:membrane protein implicated in regulation of membrane protease activity